MSASPPRKNRRRRQGQGRRGESLREVVTKEISTSSPRRTTTSSRRPPTACHADRGVNGTGKTTTIGKLANCSSSEGQRPLVCAADTFRAAAGRAARHLGKRAGVDIVRAKDGSDPPPVVFDAIQSGKAKGCDPILVDTAGRLHTRVNLMNELDKIRRVAARAAEGAPHEVLLVLDATVGRTACSRRGKFTAVAGVTGIVLTKLDGTPRAAWRSPSPTI
jgi:fused signal recognition particle receptor